MIIKEHTALDGTISRARYSRCMRYRYTLHRHWDGFKDPLTFIMLNPSTATEMQNDPTVERCERRARSNGYGGLVILNIFAFRATDPRDMKAQADPIGEDNDNTLRGKIAQAQEQSRDIVCGWGTHATFLDRGAEVLKLFEEQGMEPHALRWTKDGHPQHPLYVPYSEQPKVKVPA